MFKQLFKNNEDKAEMSFFDHLEELRWHIIRSLFAILIGFVVIFVKIGWVYDRVIMGPAHPDFITYRWLCKIGHLLHLGNSLCMEEIKLKLQSTELSGQFMLSLTTSFIGGFIIAFPYIFWEFWRFVKPALKPSERKYTRGIIFWVSLLFFLGVLFGYYLITPYTVNFFANYSVSDSIENRFLIQNYLDIITQLVLGTGLVFQLPVVVFFLSKVGLLTPSFMKNYRRHAIVVILVVAAVITPPDVASQLIVSLPLLLLYEISIFICAKVNKQREKDEAKEWM